MRLSHTNPVVCTLLRNSSNLPTNSFKKFTGKYKWYTEPVYVHPVVTPLQRGPDFSFLDGRSPRITHQFEWDRREEQTKLAKQIVKCLGEIKEAEQLHSESKRNEEQKNGITENWSLSPKGNAEFS